MKIKLQISIDEELMKRVDEYCKKKYLKRSQVLSLAVASYLDSKLIKVVNK